MKNLICSALLFCSVCLSALAQPSYVRNPLDTNSIALPPDDTFILGVVAGLPAWIQAGTNQTVINSIVTNVTFLNAISNYFVTNNMTFNSIKVSGNATLNNFIVTNAVATHTNKWSGPTNTLDFNVYSQSYSSPTAIQITGFNLPTNAPEGVALQQVSNTSATNWVATFPASVVAVVNGTIGATSATATNGTTLYLWWHYTPANNGGRTNLVVTQL